MRASRNIAQVLRQRRRRIQALLARLSELGTDGYPPEVQRRLKILNAVAYIIAASTLAYAAQHSVLDKVTFAPVITVNLLLVVVALLVPLAHRINDIAGGLMLALAEYAALFYFMAHLGNPSGVHLQYFVGAAAPFLILGLARLKLVIALVAGGLVLHVASWLLFPRDKALIAADDSMLDALYVTAATTTVVLIAATVYYAFRLAEKAQGETDALLCNILPASVVERLKLNPRRTIADSFEAAGVLFADLKGFVPTARKLGPAATVNLLNGLMSRFDELADRHGVEKIKTIGDAYMAAAGVPETVPDPGVRLARLALDMIAAVDETAAEHGIELQMRIGLATGPLMGGVIGTRRLAYDIWGDTVNLAARLEATSDPGRIHVPARLKSELEGLFHFTYRGPIEIKGIGQEETWFLERLQTPCPETVEAVRRS